MCRKGFHENPKTLSSEAQFADAGIKMDLLEFCCILLNFLLLFPANGKLHEKSLSSFLFSSDFHKLMGKTHQTTREISISNPTDADAKDKNQNHHNNQNNNDNTNKAVKKYARHNSKLSLRRKTEQHL
jgi:hypothetical protein